LHVLETFENEIHVDEDVRTKAVVCIDRMLDFAAARKANVTPGPDLAKEQTLFAGIGPA
jgi:quinolinate synthase